MLTITLLVCSALQGWAAEVLVLQSSRDAANREAVRGFEESYQSDSRVVVLSDYAEVDVVRLVKEEHPQLVVAVGETALSSCRKLRDLPVVAMLAVSVNHRNPPSNVYGVNLVADPAKYLELFTSLHRKRVGVLYDPKKTGRYLHQAVQAARSFGVTLETVEVNSAQEVQAGLEKLKGRVDALWFLPDSTVASPINLEAFLLFSINNKVPIVSYLKQHLRNGAAASLDVDFYEIGRQAGALTLQLRRKGSRSEGYIAPPHKVQLNTNEAVLHKLGIAFPNQ